MKNLLKLSLAAIAVAALTACGGGSSTPDAADAYVGTWKSVCYSYTNSVGTGYTKRIRTYSKTSATEITSSTISDSPYTDANCTNVAGTWSSNTPSLGKYVLGAKAQFLGANTDTYVFTNLTTPGPTYSGYIVADGTKLFLADTQTGSAPPTGWGIYSPYTKQ
jgi:hypothetical protein